MLTFKETRKSKRDLKIESKSKLNDQPKVRKPAWVDKNVQPIVINEQSRLRKLMKTEAETEISGEDTPSVFKNITQLSTQALLFSSGQRLSLQKNLKKKMIQSQSYCIQTHPFLTSQIKSCKVESSSTLN
jgi:hypothetical protein